MLRIQIDNEKECSGPGDPIIGSVIFSSPSTIYVEAVVITFGAKSNVAADKHSASTALFVMSTTLYENDKMIAQPYYSPVSTNGRSISRFQSQNDYHRPLLLNGDFALPSTTR